MTCISLYRTDCPNCGWRGTVSLGDVRTGPWRREDGSLFYNELICPKCGEQVTNPFGPDGGDAPPITKEKERGHFFLAKALRAFARPSPPPPEKAAPGTFPGKDAGFSPARAVPNASDLAPSSAAVDSHNTPTSSDKIPQNEYGIPKRPENRFAVLARKLREQRKARAKEGAPVIFTFAVGDVEFDEKELATRFERRRCLLEVAGDERLADWLVKYQSAIEDAFWASDNRLGNLLDYLARIPQANPTQRHWLVNHRAKVLRAFALGNRHELDNT